MVNDEVVVHRGGLFVREEVTDLMERSVDSCVAFETGVMFLVLREHRWLDVFSVASVWHPLQCVRCKHIQCLSETRKEKPRLDDKYNLMNDIRHSKNVRYSHHMRFSAAESGKESSFWDPKERG